nr:hypothetical protein [Brevundimonas naejangsanensis]
MIVSYPIHPLSYPSSAYGDYATAREAEAGIDGEWFWLGIYNAGHQFEINQLMLGFDTSERPALPIEDVTLELPIQEAYGLSRILVLHYDWNIGGGSYVKGSQISELPVLAEFTVDESDVGTVLIKLNASELPEISRVALVPAELLEPVYNGSGDDTTLIIEDGIKLHVTFRDAPPAIEAEAEGTLILNGLASGSPVIQSEASSAFLLEAEAGATLIGTSSALAHLSIEASMSGTMVGQGQAQAMIDLFHSGEATGVNRGDAEAVLGFSLMGQATGTITALINAELDLMASASGSLTESVLVFDPSRSVLVPSIPSLGITYISTRAV